MHKRLAALPHACTAWSLVVHMPNHTHTQPYLASFNASSCSCSVLAGPASEQLLNDLGLSHTPCPAHSSSTPPQHDPLGAVILGSGHVGHSMGNTRPSLTSTFASSPMPSLVTQVGYAGMPTKRALCRLHGTLLCLQLFRQNLVWKLNQCHLQAYQQL